MNNFELEYSLETLPVIARELLAFCGDARVCLFDAPMGAGKTTLIKELCKTLGSKDAFSSPTFAIVNEYGYPEGKIFHFDLYRLNNPEELLDIGFEEYIHSGNYCFIEWPELAEEYITGNFIKVSIKNLGNIRYLHATNS
ncbi:MAG: hypothetical protein JWO32_811 [Bacteroidetes bacterium]|nr:hypothetical protein [Bacteroidota bacterium]